MEASKRIIINSIAQYTRSILNMVLALIATRVILKSLGVDDYGIYSVIAGAVSLLTFITSALVSDDDKEYADENNIRVIDGNELVNIIFDYL